MPIEPVTHLEKTIAGTVEPVTHLEQVISKYGGGGGGGGAVSSVNGKTGAVVLTAADLDDSFKDALLDCFANVAWATEDGQQYYDALEAALYPIDHITAVYTQSGTVYDTDSLDSLKADLVVTAFYQGGGNKVVTTYTLSGTLTEGTSTITVSYGGKTASFDVTVTHATVFYTITNNLTGVTNTNANTRIAEGETYTGVLSANTTGYQPANVSVVVGGNDVTATAYNASNKTITITNVSGNIVIAAVEEEIQVEYGQVYIPTSGFRVDLGSLSENVSKVAVDILLEEQTFSTNVVLCTVGGTTWLGFTSAKVWLWNNGDTQELNGKTVNDIIGQRSQVFFAVNSSYKDVGIGFPSGQYSCNMTVFGVKFYGASDNLIGDFVPTSTVGEWKNRLTGTTKTASRCTNITVVEVT